MDPAFAQAVGGISIVFVLFGCLLAILWVLVPFAVFGIKPLLRRLIAQLETIEKQNVAVIAALRESRPVVQPVVVRDDRPLVP
ncbi:MAG: hypothetical protein JWL98_972 [Xanthomonadaceae bacterium]|nr:hypothetical protein [Xanthomonadaceae bacterium]